VTDSSAGANELAEMPTNAREVISTAAHQLVGGLIGRIPAARYLSPVADSPLQLVIRAETMPCLLSLGDRVVGHPTWLRKKPQEERNESRKDFF
jgi:hypothetical protein